MRRRILSAMLALSGSIPFLTAAEFRTFALTPLKIPTPGKRILTLRSAKPASENLRLAWLFIFPIP